MTSKTILTALAAALALTACGGGDEAREKQMEAEAAKHGIDADVELDNKGEVKSVTVNNANGAKIGTNLSLPDDFPADVPVDGDWSIMSTSPVPNGFMLQATSMKSVDETLAGIRKAMTAKGWTEDAADQPNAMMSRIGFIKDDRMTSYNLMSAGPSLNVQLVTMKKPG